MTVRVHESPLGQGRLLVYIGRDLAFALTREEAVALQRLLVEQGAVTADA